MTNQFHKLLLSELRMVVCQPGDSGKLNDRLLCKAVTLNENLQSLGFVLKPEDLARLAVSPSLDTFYEDVKALLPEVKAQPMYPGFPQQVMEMSEAEFRMHQMMHYFSTYGVEAIFGVKVSRGWLPSYVGLQRTKEDTTLLEERVLELVAEGDAPLAALTILMARRERLTNPELDLIVECASVCTAEQMQNLTVRFKENLELLFPKLLEEADRETALRTLRTICSHSGDVLRCTAAYISRRRYHLRTSEKKLLVKLLESYPVWNFRENLMLSNTLRERNVLVLQYLDYNQYSRSPEHKEAVRALRNGELRSWHAIGEEMLQAGDSGVLQYLAQRPGYMLRMLNRLLSLGYSRESILEVLAPRSGAISGHLILQVIRSLSGRGKNLEAKYRAELDACRKKYGRMQWQFDVYRIQEDCQWETQDCINRYEWEFNRLLPQNAIRQEWNACTREARDRRWSANRERDNRMEQATRAVEEAYGDMEAKLFRDTIALGKLKDTSVFCRWPYLRATARYNMEQAADTRPVSDAVLMEYLPSRFQKLQTDLLRQVTQLETQRKEETARMDTWRREELRKIRTETSEAYEAAIRQIDAWERETLAALEEKIRNIPDPYVAAREALTEQHRKDLDRMNRQHRQRLAAAEQLRKTYDAQLQKELGDIEEKYRRIARSLPFNDAAVGILTELLHQHFRQAVTPLRGKKVFCDLQRFDLKHSVLETVNRSKDGGYIRSGIAWKIPDNARYVRFFIYWNDPERVDIDLHAGGVTMDGTRLHVGWNGDYRNCGVVHSGDITHSNAAEYIDIDLSAPIRQISTNVHLFGGKQGFPEVETCYVGMMAVDRLGQDVKHYSPQNCFFTHELTQHCRNLFYGFVDVSNRCVRFVGQPNGDDMDWAGMPCLENTFSLQDYLDCVLDAQQAQLTDQPESAEVVLTMGKSLSEKGVSLVDHNFFLEC